MGLYDEVLVTCPSCYNSVIFQSKSGDCMLKIISMSWVPIEIAKDIVGDHKECSACGHIVEIIGYTQPDVVELVVK